MIARRLLTASGAKWYDGLDFAWQAKGAGSLAESYVDLTGNGHTLTASPNNPTLSADGWETVGSNVLISDIVPALNTTIIARVITLATVGNGGLVLAGDTLGNSYRMYPNFGGEYWQRASIYTQAYSPPEDYVMAINGNGDIYKNTSNLANVGQVAIVDDNANSKFAIMGFATASSILAFVTVVAVGGMLDTSLSNITDYISAMAAL